MSEDKDKPWKLFRAIQAQPEVEKSIMAVFNDLADPCVKDEPFEQPFDQAIRGQVEEWAKEHCPKDPRFAFKD
jgi:hypothetical protein